MDVKFVHGPVRVTVILQVVEAGKITLHGHGSVVVRSMAEATHVVKQALDEAVKDAAGD